MTGFVVRTPPFARRALPEEDVVQCWVLLLRVRKVHRRMPGTGVAGLTRLEPVTRGEYLEDCVLQVEVRCKFRTVLYLLCHKNYQV